MIRRLRRCLISGGVSLRTEKQANAPRHDRASLARQIARGASFCPRTFCSYRLRLIITSRRQALAETLAFALRRLAISKSRTSSWARRTVLISVKPIPPLARYRFNAMRMSDSAGGITCSRIVKRREGSASKCFWRTSSLGQKTERQR